MVLIYLLGNIALKLTSSDCPSSSTLKVLAAKALQLSTALSVSAHKVLVLPAIGMTLWNKSAKSTNVLDLRKWQISQKILVKLF